MGDYRRLQVFYKAHRLTLDIYAATRRYPQSESFGLTSQTRRAAASIGSNLAEGSGRDSDRELARFVRIALGSASELEYHLMSARDLGLLPGEDWASLDDVPEKSNECWPRLRAACRVSPLEALPALDRRRRPLKTED